MTKFTLNLRKPFAVTRSPHMDRESEISGPLVYPPAGSSDTLPSNLGEIKPRQGFSFRWKKRRTGPTVAQLVGKSDAQSKLGLRSRTKSNPSLRNSSPESKEIPRFVTLFLRRSTPSWRSERELHIKSDTLGQSFLGSEATSPESPCDACLPIDPTPNRSPKLVTSLRDLFGQERRPFAESLTGGTMADVVSSDSPKSPDEIDWRSIPIPPIIISSPTLPDGLCFSEESNSEVTQKLYRRVDSERKKPSGIEDLEEHTNYTVVAKTLQSAARQLANDPSAQTNIFRLLAPITAFLYILGIGVILLEKGGVNFEPGTKALQFAVYAFVIPLGMLLVLALLRGLLWVMNKLGHSFCELDLEEVFARGIFVESEGERRRLTDADFIVGNLIT